MTAASAKRRATTKLARLSDLTPSEWNPRLIRDKRFDNLCRAIAADPAFLWNRPVLAMADGTIYGGNMRYRAVDALWKNGAPPPRRDTAGDETEDPVDWPAVAAGAGIQPGTVPAIVEDVDERLAKERAAKDNAQWGEWADDELSEMLYDMAQAGSDLTLLGFDDKQLEALKTWGDEPAPNGFRDLSAGVATDTTCPRCGYQWSQGSGETPEF